MDKPATFELCNFHCPDRLSPNMDSKDRTRLISEAAERLGAAVVTERCSGFCNYQLPETPSETHVALTRGTSGATLYYDTDSNNGKPFKLEPLPKRLDTQ